MGERQVRNVGILIFDDVEVLDFCGPFEVFSVALGAMDPVEVGRRSGEALRAVLDETRRRSQP